MSPGLLFVVLTFTVMRVTRFIWMDDLIKEPRVALKGWLQLGHIPDDIVGTPNMEEWLNTYHNEHPRRELFRRKAFDLIDCGWCISIWVSALTVVAVYLFTDVSLPLPVFWWLALSGAAVALLEWTDGERNVILKQPKK